MSNINKTVLVGRLTRDAELKALVGGSSVLKFSIAVNGGFHDAQGQWIDRADFFECEIWGKRAEAIAPYMTKGKAVAVEGRLRQDRWEDQETGKTRSQVRIRVGNIDFMGDRAQTADVQPVPVQQQPVPQPAVPTEQTAPIPQQPMSPQPVPQAAYADSDIPF